MVDKAQKFRIWGFLICHNNGRLDWDDGAIAAGYLVDQISTTPFEFNIDVYGNDTFYYAVFGNADTSKEDTGIYDADFVETAMPAVLSDSELARQLHVMAGLEDIERTASAAIPNTEHPVAEHMRSAFCDRVAKCRGVIDGQCWALGAKAIEEVLREALRENNG